VSCCRYLLVLLGQIIASLARTGSDVAIVFWRGISARSGPCLLKTKNAAGGVVGKGRFARSRGSAGRRGRDGEWFGLRFWGTQLVELDRSTAMNFLVKEIKESGSLEVAFSFESFGPSLLLGLLELRQVDQ
jgi:hypothetical protein